jgi:hypothetical protein
MTCVIKSLQLPKTSHMQHIVACDSMYMKNIYNLNILIHLDVFVWYNDINTTLYATTMRFLDGWHILCVMNLGDNTCHFPSYSKFNITNDTK